MAPEGPSAEQIEEFKAIFSVYDKNSDGKLEMEASPALQLACLASAHTPLLYIMSSQGF